MTPFAGAIKIESDQSWESTGRVDGA